MIGSSLLSFFAVSRGHVEDGPRAPHGVRDIDEPEKRQAGEIASLRMPAAQSV
jgi:hypothetical protein